MNINQPSPEESKMKLPPTEVRSGIIKVDPEKCTLCGLCVQNCAFKCLGEGDSKGDVPKMKGGEYICFSCFNCMAACPENAISIAETYRVTNGVFATDFPPYKFPLEPKDKDGNPAEWTEIERIIMHRRSERNFKKAPVPEPLIQRILEAGRFGPSAVNAQQWKFTVVTDPEMIDRLEAACHQNISDLHSLLQNDERKKGLTEGVPKAIFDPRAQNAIRLTANKETLGYNNAPCVIIIGCCLKHSGPGMHAGIAGMNMNLVANALGLGAFWSNIGASIKADPELRSMLGFDPPWDIETVLCIGYPAFKQDGIVPRLLRPVKWFRASAG